MCVFDIGNECFVMTKKDCKNCFAQCETISKLMERYAAMIDKSEDQDTKNRYIDEFHKVLKANQEA